MLKFKPNKDLGQNFINDPNVAIDMVIQLDSKNSDTILEIGGGYGAVSKKILDRCKYKKYFIYEIDPNLQNELSNLASLNNNFIIIKEDFLKTDLKKFQNYKVIGAIPYNITSPIIHKLLAEDNRPEIIILLIQKEFAEKIIMKSPKSNYWSNVIYGYDAKIYAHVDSSKFTPEPKVKSSILIFRKNESQEANRQTIPFHSWTKFLHHTYKSPRKMLNKRYDIDLLKKVNIAPDLRPQNLSTDDLLNLYNLIYHS